MSRYVDLDGLTWDGTKITSKIQEVQTKYGRLMGITSGWLWSDSVPHIDLVTYEEQIRADERTKTITNIEKMFLEIKYGGVDVFQFVSIDSVLEKLEQMKEQK